MKWTNDQDRFLKESMSTMTNAEIAEKMGRTNQSIMARIYKLGLRRSDKVRAAHKSRTQFVKGQEPWNKDLKGIHFSPATEFKQGHKPHNTKHDGYIGIRLHKRTQTPYKYIRLGEGDWCLYHRHVWRMHHGEIPESHVIAFKNGDTLDCRIENLHCMSRADNARRNMNHAKASVKMRKNWAEGRHYNIDNYIAYTLFPKDLDMREEVKQYPHIIELKRAQLKLRRALNEAK